jgi:hypothetical protein
MNHYGWVACVQRPNLMYVCIHQTWDVSIRGSKKASAFAGAFFECIIKNTVCGRNKFFIQNKACE